MFQIVHNGIIENYTILKNKLTKLGYKFNSETDSEVIAHLLDFELTKDEPTLAIKKMLKQLEGAFAIAIIFKNLNLLAGSRKGSPLALGISDDSTFIGSDSVALAPFTKKLYSWRKETVFLLKITPIKFLTKNLEKLKEKLPYLVIQIKI